MLGHTTPCNHFLRFLLFTTTFACSAVAQSVPPTTVQELTQRIADQEKQIEQLRSALEEQKVLLIGLLHADAPKGASGEQLPRLGEVASLVGMVPAGPSAAPPRLAMAAQTATAAASPLSFQIGSAYITPVGFMDFTAVFRSTNPGTGIGTNFGSIPYNNTVAGRLTETRLSAQNSRIGLRADAKVGGANVLGYLESDFLGFNPGNVGVSSNSSGLRLRVYWVDVRKGKFEFLGGQSWSMITPNRKGISPLPGDIFFTQDIDVNYQAGLVWGRIPQFRMVYHSSDKLALGLSLENPEQYIGGSGGGGLVTLPSALATPFSAELNNGNTTLSTPGLHPDIIAKIAYEGKTPAGRDFHLEIMGVERSFKVFNPLNGQHFTTAGGGGAINANIELFKNFRLITNNFWSDGGGRWIFGLAPDLVVRGDGSLSLVHSGSTVSGMEFTHGKEQYAFYYGGVYIQRNSVIDPANGRLVGYGFSGSPNTQNRTIQQLTFDWNRTFWKDAKYGALNLMTQYSYLLRTPWFVAPGAPRNAHFSMVFLNLRYSLPGAAPTVK